MKNEEICRLIKDLIGAVNGWHGLRRIRINDYDYDSGLFFYTVTESHPKEHEVFGSNHVFELIHDIEVIQAWFRGIFPERVCPLCGGVGIHEGCTCPLCGKGNYPDIYKVERWLYEFRSFCKLPILEQLEHLNKNRKQ